MDMGIKTAYTRLNFFFFFKIIFLLPSIDILIIFFNSLHEFFELEFAFKYINFFLFLIMIILTNR